MNESFQVHLIRNHPNGSANSRVLHPFTVKIGELLKKAKECHMNTQRVRVMTQQMVDNLQYCASVEEETPPRHIQKQDDNVYVPSCGTLLLKIPAKKLSEQLSIIQSSVYSFFFLLSAEPESIITSSPFHTVLPGYKMCVRLHLDGNGAGKSTHLSAYLIIMRGDYDAIVTWPFHFQVIFGLYDVINQKDHIVEAFQPDPASTSFQRPQNEMNIAFGISKFVPLEKLRQPGSPYMVEEAFYMKVMVREEPIPTCILHEVMNIDPALPVYFQEELIKQAIEKSKKSSLTLHLSLKARQPC